MIDVVDIAFNICLITLFAVVVAHASVFYVLKKNRFYLYVMGVFAIYIVDDVVIYLTEALDFFADAYNEVFMSSPSVKTVIYIALAVFMMLIQNSVFRKRFSVLEGVVLIVFGPWLMFVPMMPHGVMKVWLFYLPFQIFTFFFSLYGLVYMRRETYLRHAHTANRYFYFLLILTMVFSLLIAGEDAYVIFFVDDYSSLAVSIYQRNHCEDILRILYSVTWIVFFTRKLAREKEKIRLEAEQAVPFPGEPEEEKGPQLTPAAVPHTSIRGGGKKAEERPESPVQDRACKIMLYARHLHLTGRETEILKLLLSDRSNQEIGDELVISIGTVKTHVHNIFQKVDVKRREDLIEHFDAFSPEEEHFDP